MNTLLLGFYRLVIAPAAVLTLPLLALFIPKIRLGLKLRRKPLLTLPAGADPVWIHAASGEFEYAKAVIRELKTRHPDVPVVVTYFSPTFAGAAAAFPGVDEALALPLDLPGPCRSFLHRIHPRLLLVARTDLWPEMLEQCRRRGVPVVLFSYTQKEFRSRIKQAFTTLMLHWVDRLYCVADIDKKNLQPLGLQTPTAVTGDTRYDQVRYRLTHGKVLPPALRPDRLCLIAGSTWPEDEAVLLPALQTALQSGRLKLLLVPHEPHEDHVRALEAQIGALGLKSARFSEERAWDAEQVLIVDRVGVLAELYAWAQLAFVGGSFRKSVHSVMEALGAGCVTFVGPFHENNREALEFRDLRIGARPGLEVVRDAAGLEAAVNLILQDPAQLSDFSRRLQAEFNGRLGASRRLADAVEDLLV